MPKAQDCKFAKTHEWVYLENDTAVVGISDYAQEEISDIVFVELPKTGSKVEQGKACVVIESVKAASDFFAPVSGEVIEINAEIENDPSIVNQFAHEKGWFFKIKVSNPEEISNLMDFNEYQEFIKSGH